MLPGIGEDLKKFRLFCQERALHRRQQGSHTKDLFHYLVGTHFPSSQVLHGLRFGILPPRAWTFLLILISLTLYLHSCLLTDRRGRCRAPPAHIQRGRFGWRSRDCRGLGHDGDDPRLPVLFAYGKQGRLSPTPS